MPMPKVEEVKFISQLLNRIAYEIFTRDLDDNLPRAMVDNLVKAVQRLYDRDQRLKLFEKDFWLVNKDLSKRLEGVPADKILGIIGEKVIQNVP